MTVKDYLLSRPGCLEDYPFGPQISVFKVKGKMFATLSRGRDDIWQMNLKCDPAEAIELRDIFEAVIPGYHMNKKHWNTVILDGTIPPGEVERMVDSSYRLVLKSLKKTERQALELKYGNEVLYRK